MNRRAHLFIYGEVVGVGFRSWTVYNARQQGLTGWVKNASNRSVEAVFEGSKEKMEEMIKLCRRGPQAALVEKVDVEWEEATGEFTDFEIKY